MSKIPRIYEVFEKRREYPRLKIDLPLRLLCSNGVEVDAIFYDLSPDGAQIRYSSETAGRLFGQDMTAQALKAVSYRLKTNLRDGRFSEDIQIGFMPVYQHRVSNETYSMGILFNSTDKPMLAKINNFLLYELQPEQAGSEYESESQDDTGSSKKRLNEIIETRLNETIHAATLPSSELSQPPDTGPDQFRQELLNIAASLESVQLSLSEIKQRLGEIERKL